MYFTTLNIFKKEIWKIIRQRRPGEGGGRSLGKFFSKDMSKIGTMPWTSQSEAKDSFNRQRYPQI